VKDEHKRRQGAKNDILDYIKKNVHDPLKNVTYAPAAIVQTYCKLLVGIITIIAIILISRHFK
jgi:hypothetical protein